MAKCKFWKLCPIYDPGAAACDTEGGGTYCGKYREFSEEGRYIPKSQRA